MAMLKRIVREGFTPFSAYFTWFIVMVFCSFQFVMQLSSGILVSGQMKELHLNAFYAGLLSSSFYIVYVSLQTPAGALVDHFRPRKLLSLGAFLCGIACLVFATTHHFWIAFIARMCLGLGSTFAFVSILYLLRRYFLGHYYPTLVGMTETAGMIITNLGCFLFATGYQYASWRFPLKMSGYFVLIWSVILWFSMKKTDPILKKQQESTPYEQCSFWTRCSLVLKRPVLWFNGIYSGLLFGLVTGFAGLWAIPYLQLAHHLNLTEATTASNLVLIGTGVGSLGISMLYTRYDQQRLLLCASALLGTFFMLLLIYEHTLSAFLIQMLCLLLGISASSYMLSFPIGNKMAAIQAKSAAAGFTNALSVITAPILQSIIGYILHKSAQYHSQLSGLPEHYQVLDYQFALLVLPIFLLIAVIIGYYLPCPQHTQEKPEEAELSYVNQV